MKTRTSAAVLFILACGACSGSAGTTVTGTGATNEPGASPYGLPTATPIGGERPHPTATPLPSNIPPTPRR